ncbi:hypothetical protein evm_004768 [Chilo suppressalis]|nr:hypothetical protein evm_004768 [Chilo suppressalis]
MGFRLEGAVVLFYRIFPPYISEFDFLEVQLKENSDATLECNAKGYPIPDIKWTFNNSNWKTEGSTLISHNISNDFGGIFRCTASNNAGTSVLTYKVTVVSAAKVNEIVVYTQGVGETVLTRADLKQGTRVRISCKALGQPVPKIQWIKSGNVLSENKSNISYADFVLEDIRTIHSGIYSCVVLNEGGMDEKKFRLEVLAFQPINVPTAGAQAFPMDGIGRLGHDPPRRPSADWWVLTTADAAGTNGLTCLPKHRVARDTKFLVSHPMTNHYESCLTSTIVAERANHLRHRAPHYYST